MKTTSRDSWGRFISKVLTLIKLRRDIEFTLPCSVIEERPVHITSYDS